MAGFYMADAFVVLIIFTIWRFFHVNRVAAWLMVPYLLWVTFAAYLNVTIAIIN